MTQSSQSVEPPRNPGRFKGDLWFFVFGFAKNVRANINETELDALQALAADLLQLTSPQLNKAVEDGSLQEICHDQ
ncbi:hypothetical protein E9531_00730 [Lampropedia puyangensis]|uniref:Uncharacterized protein n=1 Tax=Lampropedia puyangensis TaxID=1330072 RepID=A0A4S8FC17_9BURK|nr:type II toxin-antitoxin system RelE/ParE family toxin [Lampropedia puyangensis]THU05110.1 hypothetical protein E9531_00730 [Lampropedia puyangensis]